MADTEAAHPCTMILMPCAEAAPMVLAVGQIPNSVCLLGYNQLPNYQLCNPAEPGLSWCIEPAYYPQPGRRKAEGYLQYLPVGCLQSGVRRVIMARIDVNSGDIDATELSAGPNGWVALCIHDGTPTGGMTGRHVLVATGRGVTVHGTVTTGGAPWRILGLDNSGPTPALAAEVDGQPIRLALAPSCALPIS